MGRYGWTFTVVKYPIFTLGCIYAPNYKTARNAFFKMVSSILKEYEIGIPIFGGDLMEQ